MKNNKETTKTKVLKKILKCLNMPTRTMIFPYINKNGRVVRAIVTLNIRWNK